MSDLIERHQKVVIQLLECGERIKELEAERDAIEAKTIERCIRAVRDAGGDNEDYHIDAIRDAFKPATK